MGGSAISTLSAGWCHTRDASVPSDDCPTRDADASEAGVRLQRSALPIDAPSTAGAAPHTHGLAARTGQPAVDPDSLRFKPPVNPNICSPDNPVQPDADHGPLKHIEGEPKPRPIVHHNDTPAMKGFRGPTFHMQDGLKQTAPIEQDASFTEYAKRYQVSVADLAKANGLKPGDWVLAGSQLALPPNAIEPKQVENYTYTGLAALKKLADDNHCTLQELKLANRHLFVGGGPERGRPIAVLYVPAKGPSAAPEAPVEPAAAPTPKTGTPPVEAPKTDTAAAPGATARAEASGPPAGAAPAAAAPMPQKKSDEAAAAAPKAAQEKAKKEMAAGRRIDFFAAAQELTRALPRLPLNKVRASEPSAAVAETRAAPATSRPGASEDRPLHLHRGGADRWKSGAKLNWI